ncbi:MAG: hypothetical protein KJO23_03695 [Bacteroidia bacterium]|nr:hypothetical protein [Bacteroidia bacterium]NNM24088.1 hypothetical protein [Flavobacteriaceae bacterium]
MKKIFVLALFVLVYSYSVSAQVGIGTVNPSSELEIETTNTGVPALELNPQSAPTGSATGQLSVIGDQLYMYDATRAKWLSTETSALAFTSSGATSNVLLKYGEVANTNGGAYMPLDGTIVYIGATTSDALGSGSTKAFDVTVKNGLTTLSTTTFNLVNWKFLKTDYNVNFNAGDYINVRTPSAGGNVTNPTVTVWVKWRE